MTGEGSPAPLIVTAQLPPDIHAWATSLRTAHFPPERNFLEAHVTLFHALPPACEGELRRCLKAMARNSAPVPARLVGIMDLGRGTALKLASEGMIGLWHELADRFHGMLSPQDRQPPRLHVTIQNKVRPREAKALQASLAAQVIPRDFAFRGLACFAYRGGPWEALGSFAFRKAA